VGTSARLTGNALRPTPSLKNANLFLIDHLFMLVPHNQIAI
jgi:hypothetical protein